MSTTLDIAAHFKKITHQPFHTIREYRTPARYISTQRVPDPEKHHKQPSMSSLKKKVKHKACFMDQFVKPTKEFPSPNKYNLSKNILRPYNSVPALNRVDPTVSRKTMFDDIKSDAKKYNLPGVGGYDLLSNTSFSSKKPFSKRRTDVTKFNNLDDVKFVSAEVPGAGFYNPHKSVDKIRKNPIDPKQWKKIKEKHAKWAKKTINESQVSSCSYSPVKTDTFDSKRSEKKKLSCAMKLVSIDQRKGMRSLLKFPSPANYNLTNQWVQAKKYGQKNYASVKLLDKFITKSARSSSVYH